MDVLAVFTGRARIAALVALLATLPGTRAAAQSDTVRVTRRAPRQVLSVQPLQSMAGIISGDYERSFGGPVTLGVGVSYWNSTLLPMFDELDARYVSGEVKARFYPGERPFHGLSVGVTLGAAHASLPDLDDRLRSSGVKIGSEVDYSWLLGREQRLALALGLGAKRVFFTAYGERFVGIYPTSRIAMGVAF